MQPNLAARGREEEAWGGLGQMTGHGKLMRSRIPYTLSLKTQISGEGKWKMVGREG